MTKKQRRAPTAAKTATSRDNTHLTPAATFSEHIRELRRRIMWVAGVFIVTSSAAYNYRDFLLHIILAPLGSQKLIYLSPGGGFGFIFQITMLAGAVVTAPVVIYHIYKFVTPALPKHARRHTFKILISSIILLLAGISFGYFVAVPAALNFLTTFADTYVKASLTTDAYLSFIISYLIGLGILFQVPLLLVFWHWIHPLTPKGLMSGERFVLLLSFVAAAIITPTPDVFNQSMVAVPLIFVYQLGVIAVLIMIRRKKKRLAKVVATAIPESPALTPPATRVPEPRRPVAAPIPVMQMSQPARSRPARSLEGFTVRSKVQPQPTQPPATQRPITSLLTTNVSGPRGRIQPPQRPMSIDGLSYVRQKT
ncbi:MAG TPA: twin-arginine translocase subunit TatC [Candidatus Saccharimonadales bacterium]|jgi:sec-independent protein translocase protein TatC|nr:twin-arginine translocase subunit TatC [Candidatus Saccharimonadales bacterium]